MWGIGPSTALEIYKKGITSLEQLEENQEILNSSQQIGLKYLNEFEERIPK